MDVNTNAYRIVKALTEEKDETVEKTKKARAAAGRIGGRRRASTLSVQRKKEIAVNASSARWPGRSS